MTLVNKNPSAAVGDMVSGQPNPADNTVVPDRPAPVPLVVPAPAQLFKAHVVGDIVSGMPEVEQNRGVPSQGPVTWNDDGSNAEPKRQI